MVGRGRGLELFDKTIFTRMEYVFILSCIVFNSNGPKFNVAMFYLLGDGLVSFIRHDIMFCFLWILGSYIVMLMVRNLYLDIGS